MVVGAGPWSVGPGPDVLLVDGVPRGPLLVARTAATRGRGLMASSRVEGALWLEPCGSVHMMGVRHPIEVAVVSRDELVLAVRTLRPWVGFLPPRRGARAVVEAAAGQLSRWEVRDGAVLTVGGD